MAGRTVHTLEFNQVGVPFSPSWCVTDRELLFTLTPQNLERLLTDGESKPSLAELPAVKPQVNADARTLAMAYIDTKQVVRTLIPLAKLAMSAMGNRHAGPSFPIDLSSLPSADAVLPHLQPTLAVVRRTADGIEFESRQTLPGGNIGAAAPVAVALLLPAIQASREAARRSASMNNMKYIGVAMHNFHSAQHAFPAGYSADKDGKPLLSWRVHILPYLEEQNLYEQFHLDEPWDSPHNKKLIEQMLDVYRSPNSTAKPGMANYLGVSGADGIFVRPPKDNKMGTSMQRVTDGLSRTIMTVEVPDKSAMVWTKPGDFAPNKKDPTKGLLGTRPGGFLAGFADGHVRFISEAVDAEVLKALFTKSGGEAVAAGF